MTKDMKIQMLTNYLMSKNTEGAIDRFQKYTMKYDVDCWSIIMDNEIWEAANKLKQDLESPNWKERTGLSQ